LHPEAAYWFGVKPAFFLSEDSWGPYSKAEQNIQSHAAFIEEILSDISLLRYIQIGKSILLRAPGVLETSNALRRLKEEYKEMEERNNRYIASLEKSVQEWRETAEEKESISALRSDISSVRSRNHHLEHEVQALKARLLRQEQQSEEHETDIRRTNLAVEMQMMDEIETLRKKLGIVDKKKEKEDEKAKEKKRKAKEALKLQMKELKKQMKSVSDDSSSDSD
jgi:chromosome segregation ATPase